VGPNGGEYSNKQRPLGTLLPLLFLVLVLESPRHYRVLITSSGSDPRLNSLLCNNRKKLKTRSRVEKTFQSRVGTEFNSWEGGKCKILAIFENGSRNDKLFVTGRQFKSGSEGGRAVGRRFRVNRRFCNAQVLGRITTKTEI
jgi:hypothetical protein